MISEYERMLNVCSIIGKFADNELFLLVGSQDLLCVSEQLFAEYLMDAGMIPEEFTITDYNAGIWVSYNCGCGGYYSGWQKKPEYWK